MKIIEQHNKNIIQLCKKHKVTELYVFGSVLGNQFNKKSDIDFLVYFSSEIELLDYADNYFNFKFSLEDLFGRKIDLVEGKSLKNKYFIQEVEATKQKIYEQQNIEVFA
jgi:predicted nucleotidyltransferase